MFKYLTALLTGFIITCTANGMVKDTAIYYYKYSYNGNYKKCAPDTCDFFRLILPPDSGKKLLNIRDYYRNGNIKLEAKAEFKRVNWGSGDISAFDEQYITYYENGNRHKITTFDKNVMEDFEYYPNGKIYCSIRRSFLDGIVLWDCFNNKGELICDKGNGRWIKYDEDYNHISEQGNVKNGFKEGEWHATTVFFDTISYIIQYKRGYLKSGISYDKKGHVYSFNRMEEPALYNGEGYWDFFDNIKSHFKPPRDANGRKMSLDTTIISFVIGYDGKLSDIKVLDNVEPQFANAIVDAITQCKGWSCHKFTGIPFRTKMTFSFQYINDHQVHEGLNFRRNMGYHYEETILHPE